MISLPSRRGVALRHASTTRNTMIKHRLLLSSVVLLTGSLLAADAGLKDDLTAAAKKLGAQSNYAWKTTTDMGANARFRLGPTEGKTQKDGYTWLSMSRGENTFEVVLKGDKAAIKTDEGWQAVPDANAADADQRGRMMARLVRNFKVPAVEAEELVAKAKELKSADGACTAELTEDGVKALMAFGRRPGGDGPQVANPKGSVKFWLKDGKLAKYEFHVQGTVTFNNNDMEIDRTTTVEIKDVGTTKVEVSEEAKQKLS